MNYKIKIPDGCKVMNVEVTNNRIILEVEKEEPEFKENDIVVSSFNNDESISVFCSDYVENKFESKCAYNVKSECFITENVDVLYDKMRPATDTEKQIMFDKLKEKCLMFDGENVVRWKTNDGGKYWYICGDGNVTDSTEYYTEWSNKAYKSGNYFPTREMAEVFQKQYLELLNNFHKNL